MTRTPRSVVVRRSLRLHSNILGRSALALAVALGMFGVISSARSQDDETLAGPAVEVTDDGSGCPADHPIVTFLKDKGAGEDLNADGIVCANEVGDIVDNNTGHGGGDDANRSVTGHGNFFVKGLKKGGLLDISFSFNALSIVPDEKGGPDARGEFEYHTQLTDGPDLTVHGEVLCLTSAGNSANIIGRVTRSNDAGLLVDQLVAWIAEDNGEGFNAVADRVSRLLTVPGSFEGCRFKVKESDDQPSDAQPIVSGNVQIH